MVVQYRACEQCIQGRLRGAHVSPRNCIGRGLAEHGLEVRATTGKMPVARFQGIPGALAVCAAGARLMEY